MIEILSMWELLVKKEVHEGWVGKEGLRTRGGIKVCMYQYTSHWLLLYYGLIMQPSSAININDVYFFHDGSVDNRNIGPSDKKSVLILWNSGYC